MTACTACKASPRDQAGLGDRVDASRPALDRPSQGTVRIDGHDVASLSDRQLSALRARRIGFVFQQFTTTANGRAVPRTLTRVYPNRMTKGNWIATLTANTAQVVWGAPVDRATVLSAPADARPVIDTDVPGMLTPSPGPRQRSWEGLARVGRLFGRAAP